MGYFCKDICPFPCNTDGEVQVVNAGLYHSRENDKLVHKIRLVRTFLTPYRHETSVLIDDDLKDGVVVPDNSQACPQMIELFKYNKRRGTIGMGLKCSVFPNLCNWGSGHRYP